MGSQDPRLVAPNSVEPWDCCPIASTTIHGHVPRPPLLYRSLAAQFRLQAR